MATVAADLLVKLSGDASGLHAAVDSAVGKLEHMGKRMEAVGKTMSVAVTAPIVAGFTAIIKAGSSFESAFAGVRKTVDASEQEFQALRDAIRAMAKEIPASREEIAGVMEAAGQLGISTEHLVSFTKTMVNLGVATNMSAEEAAMSLARLANITQMPQSEFDRLGATVVHLGNNLATTESEIVEMGLRIAGAGKQVGLTEAQILGFAGALSSVGIRAEAGGSAISRFMIQMASAVTEGGDQLATFAEVAGMSADQFARAFRDDPAEAMTRFIEGLSAISQAGGDTFGVLESLGITEIRLRDAILRLAGADGVLRESLALSAQGWEENLALTEEARRRYETVGSQWQILKNRATDLLVTLYDALRPALIAVLTVGIQLIDWAQAGVAWFAQLDPRIRMTAVAIAALVAGIGPMLVVGGKFVSLISGMASAFLRLGTPIGVITTVIGLMATAWGQNLFGLRDITSGVVGQVTAGLSRLPQTLGSIPTMLQESLLPALRGVGSQIGGALAGVGQWAQGSILPALSSLGQSAATTLTQQVIPAFLALLPVLDAITDRAVATLTDTIVPTLRDFGVTVMQVITSQVLPVLSALATVARDVAMLIGTEFQPVLAAAGAFLRAVFAGDLDAARAALGGLWQALIAVDWAGIGALIRDGLAIAVGALRDVGTWALGVGADLAAALRDALGAIDWAGLGQTILHGLTTAIRTVTGIGETILSWIAEQVARVDWGRVARAIGDALGTAIRAVVGIGETILGWIAEQVGRVDWGRVAQAIGDGIGVAVTTVTDLGAALLAWLTEQIGRVDWSAIGRTIVTGIGDAIRSGWATLDATGLLDPLGEIVARAAAIIGPIAQGIVAALEPIWTSLREAGAPILEQLRGLWEALQPALAAVLSLLGPLAAIIGGALVAALGVALSVLSGLVGFFAGALPGAIQVVTGLIQVFTGVVQTIAAVVGGVVTIVVALLSGDWRGAWDAARAMVAGMATGVTTILGGLATAVTGLISGLVGGVTGLISNLVSSLIGFFGALVRAVVDEHAQRLWRGVTDAVTRLRDDVSRRWGEITSAAETAWRWVRDTVIALTTTLRDGVIERVRALRDSVQGLWTNVRELTSSLWTATREAVVSLATTLRDAVVERITNLRDRISELWGSVRDTSQQIWGGIRDRVSELAGNLRDSVTHAVTAARDSLARLWDEISRKAKDTWDEIKRHIEGAKETIRAALVWPFERFRDTVGGIVRAAGNAFIGPLNQGLMAMAAFANTIKNAINWVGQHVGAGTLIGGSFSYTPIAYLAAGTPNFAGGWAIVGEEGPELVKLPQGTAVYPHERTKRMLAAWEQQIDPHVYGGVGGIGDTIAGLVKSVTDTVRDWVSKGTEWVLNQVLSAFDLRLDLPGALAPAASRLVARVRGWIRELIDELLAKLREAVEAEAAAAAADAAAGPISDSGWVLPLPRGSYVVTQEYGPPLPGLGYSFHTGIDLAAPRGTPVFAARAGSVYAAGWDPGSFSLGYYVGIAHADNYETLYGHMLGQPAVRAGQAVAAGQRIGAVDNSGYSFGDHLHFMVRRFGNLVNPRTVLAFADGGLITEPVIGAGMRSGRGYLFGEAGWELVTPLGAGRRDAPGEGVAVHFNGPVEIVATDRRAAERAAGDIGWSVQTALKRRGLR
ncbi:MAG TPA: phage tail tape measure protein [Zeimonas sp.]|nr:phage tail tape measure protein [Zeimonas sp.]